MKVWNDELPVASIKSHFNSTVFTTSDHSRERSGDKMSHRRGHLQKAVLRVHSHLQSLERDPGQGMCSVSSFLISVGICMQMGLGCTHRLTQV